MTLAEDDSMTIRLKAATLAAALALGSAASFMMPATASAATLPLNLQPLSAEGGQSVLPVEKVDHRRSYRRHRAERRYHRRHRRHHRRHRNRDFLYYGLPLFLGTAAIASTYNRPYYDSEPTPYYGGAPRTGRHVRWCLNRYRSYNPRTDQYLAYSGYYRYCNSPYSR
jgi:hypothetical protein